MFLKVKYFAADKDQILICRVFIEAQMILFLRVCVTPYNLIKNGFQMIFNAFL